MEKEKKKDNTKIKGVEKWKLEEIRQVYKKILNCNCKKVESCTCLIFLFD